MTNLKQSEAIEKLRETLRPGDTIVTVLRHVSRSGMSRDIDLYFFGRDESAPRDRWRHCPWNGHSNGPDHAETCDRHMTGDKSGTCWCGDPETRKTKRADHAATCPVCDGTGAVPPMAGDRHWLSYWAARAGVGYWNNKRETVRMGGCGMDMGFAAVYELSHTLFGNGFALRHEWL